MGKMFLCVAAINGALAVGFGAFGAHALRDHLSSRLLHTYQTAVEYHFYHSLALLLVAILLTRVNSAWLVAAGALFTVGVFLFSGSLYVLALTNIKWLGAITPVGGLMFIAAWLCLLMVALKEM